MQGGEEMPFIQINTSEKISVQQEEDLRVKIGQHISLLPDKTEDWLMMELCGERKMFFRGQTAPCAMIAVSLYGKAPAEAYAALTAAFSGTVNQVLGIPSENIYVKYQETEYWGWNGANF